MKESIIYWLQQIHVALKSIGGSVDVTHQSDWSEADSTKASFIKNKPAIPTYQRITVSDIKALTGAQLEALEAGDSIIKEDETGKHAYIVSYKGASGLCLTYTDCENVETVAYEKSGDTWAWDSTDVTHIAS